MEKQKKSKTTSPGIASPGIASQRAQKTAPAGIRINIENLKISPRFVLFILSLLYLYAELVFNLLMLDAYPINVLDRIKQCQEVCRIFCATANPLEVIIATTDQGAGVLGVIDGNSPVGVESAQDKQDRARLLTDIIGYKR